MKRGQYDLGRKAIYLIIALFVLTFIFFYTSRTFADYNAKVIDETDWIENVLIISEIINSPNCFAFYDYEIGRAYPGIMDPAKLALGKLGDKCLVFTKKKVMVEIDGKEIGESAGDFISVPRTVLVKDPAGLKLKMMTINIEKLPTQFPESLKASLGEEAKDKIGGRS